MVDPFGFNYNDTSLVGINSHTHVRVAKMEDSKLFVEILVTFSYKNNIVAIKEKSNDHTSEFGANASCNF